MKLNKYIDHTLLKPDATTEHIGHAPLFHLEKWIEYLIYILL